ncbi:hypothetical protein [Streptodolium elevatio]|uniref:DUF559 domain-containing protein n=1 Tax=Streptodolium elevatio TaxID=3157996 RepID=A0ABV3DBC0_9ACTN
MGSDPFGLALPLGLALPGDGPLWLEEVVRRQGGVATVRQLRRGGVRDAERLRKVRAGEWVRVTPAVVLLGEGAPSRWQVAMAAVLHAGGRAVVTGLTALELAGVSNIRYAAQVHVLVSRECGVRSSGRLVYERTKRLPEPLPVRLPPTAPYARAVADACRRLADDARARATVLAAVQHRLCGVGELRREAAYGRGPAAVRMRAIVDEVASGVGSLPEAELRVLVRAAGLPEPLWNPRVYRADGRFLCSPDALWEDEGVVVEVDSVAYHGCDAQQANTAERARAMRAAGLTVVSVLPRQIRDDGPGVVLLVRDTLRAARQRPPAHLGLWVRGTE